MRNRLLLLALSFCMLPTFLLAQQTLEAGQNYYNDEEKGIVYEREWSLDMRLLTPRALALGVNIGQILSYDRTRFFNIEIGNLRHPQEYRQSFDQFFTSNRVSRSFIYGKQNNAYILRGGIGEKRYFSEKAKNRGLAIGVSYQVGANLGLIKPYHLELVRTNESGPVPPYVSTEGYSEENANLFLDLGRIVGAATFSDGLENLSVMPGFHLKAATHFDWGAFDEFVKAMEAGINVDVFFKDVPIMVENELIPHMENRPIFINLYLNLQLGKRW